MPSEQIVVRRRLSRMFCNHNPLYLISAWLVLHGLSMAFQGDVGLRWVPLMTQLLCGYTVLLSLAGLVVVRVGKIWEDARMILLVVLLMFTALSTSYDYLCLKEPATGALHLAIGFGFCCAITELILILLKIKLPARYRAPFYLQLAVLFAFPAWLGKLSFDGHNAEMYLGMLAFPVAAGIALLTLLPAARRSPESERDNGTPWVWPFFPWSIFVFVAIADAIRAWMLSLSFTSVAGSDPAFRLYFLCPILLAKLLLLLETGLRQRSKATQRIALLSMLGVMWIAFPGLQLKSVQWLTLDLLEKSLAGPPVLICGAVAMIAVVSMFRRAAGSELIVLISLSMIACLDGKTRSLHDLNAPNQLILLGLAVWQLGYGIWSRTTLRMAIGAIVALLFVGQHFQTRWPITNDAGWAYLISVLWCSMLPLFCRDSLASWLRKTGHGWLALVATCLVIVGPNQWPLIPNWALVGTTLTLALVALLYWAHFHLRWYVATAAWIATLSGMLGLSVGLDLLADPQLKRGLVWYATGCYVLVAALLLSLWKASVVRRIWYWLQQATAETE